MFNLDVQLFYFINGFAGENQILDLVFSFFATALIYILLAGFLLLVFLGTKYSSLWDKFFEKLKNRLGLGSIKINTYMLAVGIISSVISYTLSQIIAYIYFRPRPFVSLDNAVKLISKSNLDKSFPSDHTILAFAIAFSVFYFHRRWGIVFIIGALLVAISRIYVGVHYPLDIAAGILLSFFVSMTVYKFLRKYHTFL